MRIRAGRNSKRHYSLFLFLAMLVCAASSDWRSEKWSLEPFSGTYGGGPCFGPVSDGGLYSSRVKFGRIRYDSKGELYYTVGNMVAGENLYVAHIDSAGVSRPVCKLDNVGFLDGPAPKAKFTVGGGYYNAWNMSFNSKDELFLDDNGANHRVRRLYRDGNGRWAVGTYTGAGATLLSLGQSCPATALSLSGGCLSAVNSSDQLVIVSPGRLKIYRVSSDGDTVVCTDTISLPPGQNTMQVSSMDADTVGNVYFLHRGNGCVYKVDSNGRCARISGNAIKGGDGLPLDVYAFAPAHLVASADGSCVYFSGGDEYCIRRIPTHPDSTTSTFGNNGRFFVSAVYPKGWSRLPLDTSLVSTTTPYEITELYGSDAAGSLFIGLVPWEEMGFSQVGKGRLPTRVAKLVKVVP